MFTKPVLFHSSLKLNTYGSVKAPNENKKFFIIVIKSYLAQELMFLLTMGKEHPLLGRWWQPSIENNLPTKRRSVETFKRNFQNEYLRPSESMKLHKKPVQVSQ